MNSAVDVTWEALCADPSLRDLPYKIETNRYHKIIMSPASSWHAYFEFQIAKHLDQLMTGGRVLPECPVQTADGVRVADVAWISVGRWHPHRRSVSLPVCPEICVEILSPSNSREEMLGKMQLYYAAGAAEVWLCDADGDLEFFSADSAPAPISASALCPAFPSHIPLD